MTPSFVETGVDYTTVAPSDSRGYAIGRVQSTHHPILMTQNGCAASYIVSGSDFNDLMDSIDLSKDVEISRREMRRRSTNALRREGREATP